MQSIFRIFQGTGNFTQKHFCHKFGLKYIILFLRVQIIRSPTITAMNWAFSIQQKLKAAALLGIVCAIVLLTNLMGRQHIDELGSSFSSVYKDRLVVEGYIYELSSHLYQKKLLLDNPGDLTASQLGLNFYTHNAAISRLLTDYEKTRLTKEESACLQSFKADVVALQELERNYLGVLKEQPEEKVTHAQIDKRFAIASENLEHLSHIQLSEGKLLNDHSQRIVYGSTLLTSFEMVVLIAIGVLLQALVMAGKPMVSRIKQQGHLN